MSETEALRAKVEKIRWYHQIDLGHGVVTPGVDNSPKKLRLLALPESLDGKTVLDVGAWDGFFSFEAERRGAKRVLATDQFSWSAQGWGSKAGFELARTALRSKVEDMNIDVLELSPEKVGTFDVVFFLGVLYHMRHPLLALERIASVTARDGDHRVRQRVPLVSQAGHSILPRFRTLPRSDQLVRAEPSSDSRVAESGRFPGSEDCRRGAPVPFQAAEGNGLQVQVWLAVLGSGPDGSYCAARVEMTPLAEAKTDALHDLNRRPGSAFSQRGKLPDTHQPSLERIWPRKNGAPARVL